MAPPPAPVHSFVKLIGDFERNGSITRRAGSGVMLSGWTSVVLTAAHVLFQANEQLRSMVATLVDDANVYEVGVEACAWFDGYNPRYDLGVCALTVDVQHREAPILSEPAGPAAARVVGFPNASLAYRANATTLTLANGLYRYAENVGLDGMSGGPAMDDAGVVGLHLGAPSGMVSQVAAPADGDLILALNQALAAEMSSP